MCTEAYVQPLVQPSVRAPSRTVSEFEWLEILRRDGTEIRDVSGSFQPIRRRRVTRPRGPDDAYATHYLFFSSDAELLVQTLEGANPAPPGSIILFPPGIPYSIYLTRRLVGQILFRFRFSVLVNDVHVSPWRGLETYPASPWYPGFVNEVEQEVSMPDVFTAERIRSLLATLSIKLFRIRRDAARGDVPLSAGVLRKIHQHLHGRIRERPTPADLARVAGLSPAYFTKAFVKTMGAPPRRWILEWRIRRGAKMLKETGMNVNEVADALGYREARLFTRQFKSVFGESPMRYRAGR